MIRAIIFDCFGVLIGQGFEHTYRLAGGDPDHDRNFIDDMLGSANLGLISDADFRLAMADNLGLTIDEWQQAIRLASQPDAVLLTYIQELRKSYKTAVLSNANLGVIEREIGHDQLIAAFDQVVVSAEVGMVKPEARIYEHTLEKLGVQASEAIFVDDRELFLESAWALGMHAILYDHFSTFQTDLEALLASQS